jgi:uncharacterized membrane protein
MAITMAGTAAFLAASYDALPDLLPVHFRANGVPNGWQFKTVPRVLLPVFIQAALLLTLGGVGVLLLSRRDSHDRAPHGPDVRAAVTAGEAVVLIAAIWIVFQALVAVAFVNTWTDARSWFGFGYVVLEVVGLLFTAVVGVRAHVRLGRPEPRPYVPAHWRLGQLYRNPEDPALFVPTRDGSRWTLNFGRPAAAALLGIILTAGFVGPTVILVLALR